MKKINNTVRIIGGHHRGKKISFPEAEGLRPTSDRIRETLFNWLMHDIRGAQCLDLFAGSGALGFEAQSRGAAHVVFVEKNAIIYQQLLKTAATFDLTQCTILLMSAGDYLNKRSTQPALQFDIVFIDPPFDHLELFDCVGAFEESALLRSGGLLYIESPQELGLNPKFWRLLKLKKAGQVVYGLYQKIS